MIKPNALVARVLYLPEGQLHCELPGADTKPVGQPQHPGPFDGTLYVFAPHVPHVAALRAYWPLGHGVQATEPADET